MAPLEKPQRSTAKVRKYFGTTCISHGLQSGVCGRAAALLDLLKKKKNMKGLCADFHKLRREHIKHAE